MFSLYPFKLLIFRKGVSSIYSKHSVLYSLNVFDLGNFFPATVFKNQQNIVLVSYIGPDEES